MTTNERRDQDRGCEVKLTPEQLVEKAAILLDTADSLSQTIPEAREAIVAAYYGSPEERSNLTKGKITFRRGDSVWEMIRINFHNDRWYSLTKLPSTEITTSKDFQEEVTVEVVVGHTGVTRAIIHYNHLFADGKKPILYTNTNLAVDQAQGFLQDFRDCSH